MLEQTPADHWILSTHASLQEKYRSRKIELLSYLKFEVTGNLVVINADCTQVGSWLAQELWIRREALVKSGLGLKVLVGGKVVGHDLPCG
jgi:hypothetical protein